MANVYKIPAMFTDCIFQGFSVIENLLVSGIKIRSTPASTVLQYWFTLFIKLIGTHSSDAKLRYQNVCMHLGVFYKGSNIRYFIYSWTIDHAQNMNMCYLVNGCWFQHSAQDSYLQNMFAWIIKIVLRLKFIYITVYLEVLFVTMLYDF